MESVDEIFELFGGPAELGRALGIPLTHAGQMKARRSIPAEYWEMLVGAARERGIRGVTAESLMRLAARRRHGAARSD